MIQFYDREKRLAHLNSGSSASIESSSSSSPTALRRNASNSLSNKNMSKEQIGIDENSMIDDHQLCDYENHNAFTYGERRIDHRITTAKTSTNKLLVSFNSKQIFL